MKRTQRRQKQLEKLQHADRASQGIYRKLIEICSDLINGTRELRMAFRIWKLYIETYNLINNKDNSIDDGMKVEDTDVIESDMKNNIIINNISNDGSIVGNNNLLIGGSDLAQLSIKDKKLMMLDLLRGNTNLDKFANKYVLYIHIIYIYYIFTYLNTLYIYIYMLDLKIKIVKN